MVMSHIRYLGNLRCEAEHGPSKQTITTDAPVDNQGKGEYFSPTDLVGTALATCIATTMAIVAERDSVNLQALRIDVEKHMSADKPRRIARLILDVHMPLPFDHPAADKLQRAAQQCPVANSLSPELAKEINFIWSKA